MRDCISSVATDVSDENDRRLRRETEVSVYAGVETF